ncbi:HD domain-containing protein [Zooshikella ganghwensis]|uniref:Bifunctional (P)ppGpp synthetase/guanosine-3',5'-bis(Diphosphate) 3'-pyrophosphohydrolase n=1 Tax=Zooshikella ganghwensis TaxID=202772 RepID=A0A4P9VL05_9GAMM|nr:HD domain-containing protein [Zooshikella ganghwensis]RDH43456.1 bifunctional (p)ppGpp synthetase/guanosine-3',5'-bis(diphosphate) 3'-pyrophosphohydrolase [Zooshikella ganghwensis]
MIDKAKQFALERHGNQTYGDKPYAYHLDRVVELLVPYGEVAQTIGYLHDVVEDTSVTLDELAREFNQFIADAVAILSDQPGINRKEKKQKTYALMENVTGDLQVALIVKVADRLANLQACIEYGRYDKLKMYMEEHEHFRKATYVQDKTFRECRNSDR